MIPCPKCGKQLSENAEFCDSCGNQITFGINPTISSGYEGNPEPKKTPKSSKTIIIAVIAVLLAAAIAVGAFFIGKNSSSNDDDSYEKNEKSVSEEIQILRMNSISSLR